MHCTTCGLWSRELTKRLMQGMNGDEWDIVPWAHDPKAWIEEVIEGEHMLVEAAANEDVGGYK